MFDLPILQRVDSFKKYIVQTDLNTLSKNINSILDNIFGHDGRNLGWNLLKIQECENAHVYATIENFLSPFGPLYELLTSLTNNGAVTMPFKSQKMGAFNGAQLAPSQEITPLELFFQYLFNFPLFFQASSFSISLNSFNTSLYYNIFVKYLQHIFFLKDGTRLVEYLSNSMQLNVINNQFQFRLTDTFIQTFVICLIQSPEEKGPFVPNTFQVLMVRTFLKHYYRFLFGDFNHIQIQSTQSNSILSRLMEHKRYLHDSIIFSNGKENHDHQVSKSIYVMSNLANQFFYTCFERWPNDLTFSIVLDTWLVAVQPWCFANTSLGLLQSEVDFNDPQLLAENPGDWRDFILSQYPLYLALSMLFFKRINTMDLLVEGTAVMLKKMAHFLANLELKAALKGAENEFGKDVSSKRHFTGFWSQDSAVVINELVGTISTIKRKIRGQEGQKENSEESNGWINWLVNALIFDDEGKNGLEQAKLFDYLNYSEMKLCDFFNIQLPSNRHENQRSSTIDWDRSDVWHTSPLIQSRSISGTPRTPLAKLHFQQKMNRRMAESSGCNLSGTFSPQQRSHDRLNFGQNNASSAEHVHTTTPERRLNKSLNSTFDKSRYDLLSDGNKINLSLAESRACYGQTDKELLPRSSREVYFLFKLTTNISRNLNSRFGHKLRELCNRPNFLGILSRRLFCARICSINEMNSKQIEPRFRLRWLANKKNYVWLCIWYLLTAFYYGGMCSIKNFILSILLLKVAWIFFSCTLAFLIGL